MIPHRPIRVLLVDDHPVLRQGLGRLLRLEGDIAVVAEAASGRQAVEEWRQHRPDVALVDLLMPVMDGVQTVELIRGIDGSARIVILTSSQSTSDATRAERAGACGYVTKECDAREIAAAVREAAAGKTRIRRGRLLGPSGPATGLPTARETDVLLLLRQGASNAEIGRRLAISELTVKTHIRGLMNKLQAADRTAVVARAFDLGLLKAASG